MSSDGPWAATAARHAVTTRRPYTRRPYTRRPYAWPALLTLLLVLASAPETVDAGAASAGEDGNHRLLVLGDSISAAYGIQREQSWVYLLQQRLDEDNRSWQVINASLSGETTGGGLARLGQLLDRHDPDVVLIELGGNDALRGYPLDSMRDNLQRMAELADSAGAHVLIAAMEIPPNYDPRNSAAFRDMYFEVAETVGADVIPFMLEQVALAPGMMQRDGIHPTARAQPIMLDTAWPTIDAALRKVAAREPG